METTDLHVFHVERDPIHIGEHVPGFSIEWAGKQGDLDFWVPRTGKFKLAQQFNFQQLVHDVSPGALLSEAMQPYRDKLLHQLDRFLRLHICDGRSYIVRVENGANNPVNRGNDKFEIYFVVEIELYEG